MRRYTLNELLQHISIQILPKYVGEVLFMFVLIKNVHLVGK